MARDRVGGAAGSSAESMIAPLPSRQSLTDDVYEAIKTLIMDHVIAPQARLSIDQLARDLRVSSTPIREALIRLESEGLARKEALRGYSTTPVLTPDEVKELFEFRTVIEPWAAARAAQRRDAASLARLQAEVDSVDTLPTGDTYQAYRELAGHDERFHRQIAELSGNDQLLQAFVRTNCHLHLFRQRYSTRLGSATIAEHQDIAAAIAAGDAELARAAMLTHLRRAQQRLT
ncbi:GntR family transcriptional regulator [Nonomuraea sp. NPDC049269]|uniref:GntR family transcriptional regulator n=1 Tax=Nonomuraea sp. NPDC049269 TaxID=3364349 RepID=UPI003722D9AF